jgi:asparagine synthase (glutamine-hydrolysing)
MCGIAGFVAEPVGLSEEAVLRRMVATMHHRGPDETGVHLDSHAALGHARLSIIDLAGGGQPMCNEDGSLWIVFNGEIFNYVELRRELDGRGHRFATRSDTEVILHLFEDFGEDCVSRLNGQWAFAIWDAKRRRLFLSRDRLGVRPLFFTWVGKSFVFASEIKALLAYPGVRREFDLQALHEIFTFWHTLSPRTAFRGIYEIQPGHSAMVVGAQAEVKPYWNLDYHRAEPAADTPEREKEYREELLSILQDATRIRLRSDVPVAAYLSGGLDSTFITALIKHSGITQLTTFSVRFQESDLDEGSFQEEAVRQLGTRHHSICCTDNEIASVFPDVIWHAEKPILRTAPAPLYLLARLVHQHGYKVVLTGEGSDELLGGYDIFKEAKIRAFWASQPDSRLRPLLLRRLYPYMPQIQSQPPAYLRAFFHVDAPDTMSPFFSHLPRWRVTSKLWGFFSAAAKAELAASDPIASLQAQLPPAFGSWDTFTRAQYIETQHLLPGYILSSQGDRVAMAHSVEGRFPFLDHRVAEFAARLSPRMKMKVLNEKHLLKCCARPFVPRPILDRPKQPYRAPDARSFFSGAGREYVREFLSPERIRRDGIFNPITVEKLVQKARSGSLSGTADNMAAVGILSTELFLAEFMSHDPVGSGAGRETRWLDRKCREQAAA